MTVAAKPALQTSRTGKLRIALVGPARYPVREPYAGGLEAFCHTLSLIHI